MPRIHYNNVVVVHGVAKNNAHYSSEIQGDVHGSCEHSFLLKEITKVIHSH